MPRNCETSAFEGSKLDCRYSAGDVVMTWEGDGEDFRRREIKRVTSRASRLGRHNLCVKLYVIRALRCGCAKRAGIGLETKSRARLGLPSHSLSKRLSEHDEAVSERNIECFEGTASTTATENEQCRGHGHEPLAAACSRLDRTAVSAQQFETGVLRPNVSRATFSALCCPQYAPISSARVRDKRRLGDARSTTASSVSSQATAPCSGPRMATH